MVLWCKCGAFMGLREPLNDWTTDRSGICPECTKKQITDVLLTEIPTSEKPTKIVSEEGEDALA